MRKQIIALAVASIMVPTIALAADGEPAPVTEQTVVAAQYDQDGDRDHRKGKRDHDRGRKASQINYNGPVDLTPLSQLKSASWGDQDVIVEGRFIRQQANGDFILSDGKDEIVVELDDIKLSDSIDENTTLRLFGEYEGWDKKLEAEYIQVVK